MYYIQCIYYIMYMLYIGKTADYYFQILKLIQWSGSSTQQSEQMTFVITSSSESTWLFTAPPHRHLRASSRVTETCRGMIQLLTIS